MDTLAAALTLQLGYNAALVAIGAALLGVAAGTTGTFLFLRKRALVSDAISHATLPGLALAFIVMVALGGDGRSLAGLMLGSAVTAGLGLLVVQWLTDQTRLSEDAAIGAVLSVFFGAGVVLLTVIQAMEAGRQAGLDGLLLGSTAGMLRQDAQLIAIGGALCGIAVLLLRRPMTLVAFDPEFARSTGISVTRIDIATMGLVLAVTVVGLKIVGLILIVALLIIPPAAARFWTDRSDRLALIAGGIGGLSGYVGAAISAAYPNMPTGPIIVLVAFAIFVVSMLVSPVRGALAAWLRHQRFRKRVHLRQGLLAIAGNQPVYEPLTLRLLRTAGLVRADGVATEDGAVQAAKAQLDEARWAMLRRKPEYEAAAALYDGLRPIDTVLTADQIADLDQALGGPREVSA